MDLLHEILFWLMLGLLLALQLRTINIIRMLNKHTEALNLLTPLQERSTDPLISILTDAMNHVQEEARKTAEVEKVKK